MSEDGSGLSLDILLIYLKVKSNTPNDNHMLDFSKQLIDFGWELGHTISDGVCLHLLVRAGLAHSQRRGVGDATVRDWRASILGLQQIEVVGHGCRVAHDARVDGKAILVTWPGQLGTMKRF